MNPVEQAHESIGLFLAGSGEPVLMEPGSEPLLLGPGNCVIELSSGRLRLQAWDDAQNIVRRIVSVVSMRPGRLELAVERFGKKPGTLTLVDRRAPRNHDGDRRAARLTFRERFRRALRRQFPDWQVAELSTEADLEHSLSPAYPRALLRKGNAGWAVIGAAAADSADGALTFGLIWLDYLRRREQKLLIEGLALILPAERERVTALRMRWLNVRAARFELLVHSGDGNEDRLDLADYGNLDTQLAQCARDPGMSTRAGQWTRDIMRQCPAVECIARNDGSESLRIRGLEFARSCEGELKYGLETRRVVDASNLAEVVCLAGEVARMRSPESSSANMLHARSPEAWLESQVRADVQRIDASLAPEPIYGQVPAFTAGDRDVIDLLLADWQGRLAVIELKASEDIHLPLQALDYWMRVRWHAERGAFAERGYFPRVELSKRAPRLLLVAPALDFHPANEVVLRYFSSDIEVERVGVGLEWRRELKVMFRY